MNKKQPPLGIGTAGRFRPWSRSSTRHKNLAKTLGALVAILCLTLPTYAGQATWDLNDENQVADFILNSNNQDSGTWMQENGNGFIRLTPAVDSRSAAILFPDFDEGLVVSAFDFSVDVRLGDGTNPPADGFSINYARSDDPAIANIIGGGTGIWGGTLDIGGTEESLPEEGTRTGLAIGFDTWGFPGGENSAVPGSDLRGISIRVDGLMIHQEPLPTVGPDIQPDDITSMETGPWSSEGNRGTGENLTWQPFTVSLKPDGKLTVTWKGNTVLDDFETGFFPSPGRLVFGGRTGGSYAIQDIDNISITTIPATTFLPSGLVGNASGFTVSVNDAQGSELDPSTIELLLNGEPVDFTVSKVGAISSIRHDTSPEFLPAGSTNVVRLVAQDNNGITAEFERTFTVRRYVVLQPDWRAPAGSWNAAAPGYVGRLHQLPIGRFPGDANFVWNAERHLAGGYIDPATSQPYASIADTSFPEELAADGTFTVPGFNDQGPYINWNQDVRAQSPSEIGSFTANTGMGYPDSPIPGIPDNLEGSSDNIAAEFYSYVELQGGRLYTMVVNSDDGFRVTAGPEIRSILTTNWLGQFNGGKGASDVQFDVIPLESGVYRFRLAWWEGGGGANLEFFHLMDDGSKVMFNDPYNPQAAKSYQPSATPQPLPPAIVSVVPWPGQGGVNPLNTPVQIIIADGTGAAVDANSIQLTVNGAQQSITTTRVGDKVRVNAAVAELLPGGVAIPVEIQYTAGGETRSESYTFNTIAYPTLPPSLGTEIGTGANPGMRWRTHQLDAARGTTIALTEQQLAGELGPSVHNTAGQEADGFFYIDYVNFSQDPAAEPSGNFQATAAPPQNVPDLPIPGIPGAAAAPTDNIGAEAFAYLELQPGFYTMVVNSDDGFQVSMGNADNPRYLVLGLFDAGRGAADTVFNFVVDRAGVYLFRLLWFEGGGGANVEWFTVNADGSRALVNGTQTGSISAFRTRTVPEPELPSGEEATFNLPTLADGQITLSWEGSGTLQESTNLVDWTNSPNQSNPQTVVPEGTIKAYRIQVSP